MVWHLVPVHKDKVGRADRLMKHIEGLRNTDSERLDLE